MADPPATHLAQLPAWAELNDLSSKDVGGGIVFATDDWFAAAENLLESSDPVWKEGFTEQGKWMDGWETRRKRIPGHDWCIVRLGLPGIIHGIEIATDYFTGNYAPKASVQAARLEAGLDVPIREGGAGKSATEKQFQDVGQLCSEDWSQIVGKSVLGAGYKGTSRTFFAVDSSEVFSHIRLNIFPDGGVARIRVYGVCVPVEAPLPGVEVDLVSALLGGMCVGYSNAHYGHPRNMIRPGRGKDMGDGWETARRLDRPEILEADENGILKVPGSEWAIFKLGVPGNITRIDIDTNHFKGNYPDSSVVEGTFLPGNPSLASLPDSQWKTVLPAVKLSPHKEHFYSAGFVQKIGEVSHIRVKMFPDGGISRLRVWGTPSHKSQL